MSKVKVKKIKGKSLQIRNAWDEGAPDVDQFRNTKKTEYDAKIAAGQAVEDEIADLYAQISIKEDERDVIYASLDDDNVDIRKGVAGHADYGDDSPLYGAMGFVRTSERRSGLTRKSKNGGNTEGDNQ